MLNKYHRTVAALLLGAALALSFAIPAGAAEPQPFRAGDRVAFMGDSITHNGLYHSFIYLFYQTRYPDAKLEMYNCGISGGRTIDAAQRLTEDVLAHKPTVVVINLGMNDVGTSQYLLADTEKRDATTRSLVERYQTQMREIAARIKAESPGSRVIVTTPSPYDQTGTQERESAVGKNDAIAEQVVFLRGLAADNGFEFVDWHTLMTQLNAAGQAKDPNFTLISPDRVHPGPLGHLIMASQLLKEQGVDGLVSGVELYVANGAARVIHAEKADVSDVRALADGVSFTVLEKCLPYPVEPEAAGALDLIPFQEELNRQVLRVRGLEADDYTLEIDGAPVGTYTAAELAAGVNLAGNTHTPQYQQAMAVAALNNERWDAERPLRGPAWVKFKVLLENDVDPGDPAAVEKALEQWRADELGSRKYNSHYDEHYMSYKDPAAYAGQERLVNDLVDRIYAANKPQPHTYAVHRGAAPMPEEAPAMSAEGANAGLEKYATMLAFDDMRSWRGLTVDLDSPKEGVGAGLWADTVGTDRIQNKSFPADLSAFDTMTVWVHSAKASGAKIAFAMISENPAVDGPDYYFTNLTIDWTGWKQVVVPFSGMRSVRSPQGFDKVTGFLMASSGYSCGEPSPDTHLKFDAMEFVKR